MKIKKKLLIITAAAVAAGAAIGTAAVVSRRSGDALELPVNELDYRNREGSELVPGGVEEHGAVLEDYDRLSELPSEDELGEYEEIFLDGDYLDDGGVGGWVLAISLKDITLNTYNEITTYTLGETAKAAADHIKPGDAALVYYTEEDDGEKVAYKVSRVRVEDEPLTDEEIAEMYKSAQGEE